MAVIVSLNVSSIIGGGMFMYPQKVSIPAYPLPISWNAKMVRKLTKELLPRQSFFTSLLLKKDLYHLQETLVHAILNE